MVRADVPEVTVSGLPAYGFSAVHRRRREGFALTDKGTDVVGALDQANYCIWCHNQGKDSCSTGLKEKSGEFKKSPFGVTLAGCPLDEKISELNLSASRGLTILFPGRSRLSAGARAQSGDGSPACRPASSWYRPTGWLRPAPPADR